MLPTSSLRGTFPSDVPRAPRLSILSPRSSVAPTAASRPNFCSIRVLASFSLCVSPGIFLDDDGFASLEYAVKFLGAPLVMVLGHTNCGAIAAAIKVVKERSSYRATCPS